jgi:hypothetical protein
VIERSAVPTLLVPLAHREPVHHSPF